MTIRHYESNGKWHDFVPKLHGKLDAISRFAGINWIGYNSPLMNPFRFPLRFLVVTITLVLFGERLSAQLTTGFVSGIVLDPSAAVIRDARISIMNIATSNRRETVTNEKGIYRIVGVEPGVYEIEFASPGFETVKLQNVAVGPAQEVVLNQEMPLPGEQISIDVQESNLVVGFARASPTIDQVFDRNTIQSLPMSSAARDVTGLALASPLVTRAPGSSELSANGQRARHNNYQVDATDNND
jgi:hypothetical protein